MRPQPAFLLLSLIPALPSCSGGPATQGEAVAAPSAEDSAAQVERLRADSAALAARAEHKADRIEVQHVLISFQGAPRMDPQRVKRSREEAEVLAADVYAQALAGAEFGALVEEHTDDSPPGIYSMTQNPKVAAQYQRQGMVPAFGNVGWRLEVGEVGVAPLDPKASPFGWHIIKRLK
jgi:parvulin-like peptidyl-prolyl isomerase